jgi:hypothetical protein
LERRVGNRPNCRLGVQIALKGGVRRGARGGFCVDVRLKCDGAILEYHDVALCSRNIGLEITHVTLQNRNVRLCCRSCGLSRVRSGLGRIGGCLGGVGGGLRRVRAVLRRSDILVGCVELASVDGVRASGRNSAGRHVHNLALSADRAHRHHIRDIGDGAAAKRN